MIATERVASITSLRPHPANPADSWSPASGAKRKSNLTDEQRRAAGERLRAVRS